MTTSVVKWGALLLVFVALLGYIGWIKYDNSNLQKTIVERDKTIQLLEISSASKDEALQQSEMSKSALSKEIENLLKAQDLYIAEAERNRKLVEQAKLEPIDTTKVADYETVQKAKDILSSAPISDSGVQYKD